MGWDTRVAKVSLGWLWDGSDRTQRLTTMKSGFGGMAEEGQVIKTSGLLQMHPLFGMNTRCLLYEGFRTILLARGTSVSAPERIFPGR